MDANETMETMHQAISRLEQRGFKHAFLATRGGGLEVRGGASLEPETCEIVETVRFEGQSNPEDSAVLFALRSPDGKIKGTFVASYGTDIDRDNAAAIERLQDQLRNNKGASNA